MSSRRVAAVQTRESGDQGAGLGELAGIGNRIQRFCSRLGCGQQGNGGIEDDITRSISSPLILSVRPGRAGDDIFFNYFFYRLIVDTQYYISYRHTV